jgi:hypothetical protein
MPLEDGVCSVVANDPAGARFQRGQDAGRFCDVHQLDDKVIAAQDEGVPRKRDQPLLGRRACL